VIKRELLKMEHWRQPNLLSAGKSWTMVRESSVSRPSQWPDLGKWERGKALR